jgi:outer membrane protein assembly factor BamB
MFVLDDSGVARKLSTTTGKVLWSRRVGTLAAATPAIDARAGLVLMPTLSDSGRTPGHGRFVALSMKTGKVKWSFPLAAGSESSAIVNGTDVYFGDGGGTLYALNARTGHRHWTYHAKGAIKGGPALLHGVLYFGDYAGRAYAVHAASGKQKWAVSTGGAHFGLGSGSFYATPTVDYGRVYMGNTDGRMYSFAQRNGALAWATETGGYVYSSAAVADPKGLGPTVYAGSYDGYFYAFNARTGAVRWKVASGGKISGSATIIGDDVYYADLETKHTLALNIVTGRKVLDFPDGAFTAAVADDHAIYLIGFADVYQMLPGATAKQTKTKTKTRSGAGARSRTQPQARTGPKAKARSTTRTRHARSAHGHTVHARRHHRGPVATTAHRTRTARHHR